MEWSCFSKLAHCGSMNRVQGNLQLTKTFQTLFSEKPKCSQILWLDLFDNNVLSEPNCGLLNLSCPLVILGRIYGVMNNLFNWSTAPFIFPLVDTLWWSVFCMLEKRTKNMLVYLSSFSQEKVTVSAGYDCVGIPKQTKASSSLFGVF